MGRKENLVRKELIKLWFDYHGSGTPYGNTFEGFMNWLVEREAKS